MAPAESPAFATAAGIAPGLIAIAPGLAGRAPAAPRCRACRGAPAMATSRRGVLAGAAAAAAAALLPAEGTALTAPSLGMRTVASRAAAHSVLYERASGSLLPVSALGSVLRKAGDCVIIGEVHTEVGCHSAQLAVLETLKQQGGNRGMTVGFEMFGVQQTPILAMYIDGEIGLDEMLERTKWNSEWGYAADLYSPIFRFCRASGVRMIGLNIPSKLIRCVSAVGLAELEASYPTIRALLPKVVDTGNVEHRAHFMRAMGFAGNEGGDHAGMHVAPDLLQRYYESQCVWDEIMAESIGGAVAADPSSRVIALVGTGHMDTPTAIPMRCERRLEGMGVAGVRPYSIATRPVAWTAVSPEVSLPDIIKPERSTDLVWYTRSQLDLA